MKEAHITQGIPKKTNPTGGWRKRQLLLQIRKGMLTRYTKNPKGSRDHEGDTGANVIGANDEVPKERCIWVNTEIDI